MSDTQSMPPPPATGHMRCELGKARVQEVEGYPGIYGIFFGLPSDFHILATPEQWDAIDAAVRAGIAAATAQAVAS